MKVTRILTLKYQTIHHIPDTQQLSTSKELYNILSDGELGSEDESDDDI